MLGGSASITEGIEMGHGRKQEESLHEGFAAVSLPVLLWYTTGSTRPGCSYAAAGAAAAGSSRSPHLSPPPPGCCQTDWWTNTYIREEAGMLAWMKWEKKRSPFFRLVLPLDHKLRVWRRP